MEWLSGVLEKWKVLNVLMFVITTIGTLMGIVLGWKQFYHDYLSVQVSMPLWMLFLIILAAFILVLLIADRKRASRIVRWRLWPIWSLASSELMSMANILSVANSMVLRFF